MRKRTVILRLRTPFAVALLALVSLSASADAPAGRYTITTDTATDKKTGLTWTRAVKETVTWDQAKSYCDSLALGGFTTGWRLPTIQELKTLFDPRRVDPSIDPAAFPNTPTKRFWSGTQNASNLHMWVMQSYGGVYLQDRNQNNGTNHAVRCVR
jgi:hypothetical protein